LEKSEAESGCGTVEFVEFVEFWLSGIGPWRRFSAPGRLSIVGQPVGEIKVFQKIHRNNKTRTITITEES
jgi:hypothetical protein